MEISLDHVSKIYTRGELKIPVIREITAEIKSGSFVFIVGPSGSGKSTLLYLLGGMDIPTTGKIQINGRDMPTMSNADFDKHRREEVGFIFQNFNLLSNLDALHNILVPAMPKGISPQSKQAAIELLKQVGLEHRIHHLPKQLSGGEQQRVAIARAIFKKPSLVLADEPTGELDSQTGLEIFNLLRKLHEEQKATVIVVTHDKRFIRENDIVLEISDGKLDNVNSKQAIFN